MGDIEDVPGDKKLAVVEVKGANTGVAVSCEVKTSVAVASRITGVVPAVIPGTGVTLGSTMAGGLGSDAVAPTGGEAAPDWHPDKAVMLISVSNNNDTRARKALPNTLAPPIKGLTKHQ